MRTDIVNLRRMEEIVLDITESQVFKLKNFHKIRSLQTQTRQKSNYTTCVPLKSEKKILLALDNYFEFPSLNNHISSIFSPLFYVFFDDNLFHCLAFLSKK